MKIGELSHKILKFTLHELIFDLFTVIAYFFKVFTNASHLIHCYHLFFLRCSRTLRFDSLLSPIFKGVHECFAFHTGWSIVFKNNYSFFFNCSISDCNNSSLSAKVFKPLFSFFSFLISFSCCIV